MTGQRRSCWITATRSGTESRYKQKFCLSRILGSRQRVTGGRGGGVVFCRFLRRVNAKDQKCKIACPYGVWGAHQESGVGGRRSIIFINLLPFVPREPSGFLCLPSPTPPALLLLCLSLSLSLWCHCFLPTDCWYTAGAACWPTVHGR